MNADASSNSSSLPAGEAPVAWLVGAAGGIGSATARRLHGAGWRLVLSGRRREGLEGLAGELPGSLVLPLDARDPAAVNAAAAALVGEAGRLDAVVHLAGSILLKPAHLVKDAEWAETLETNLTSAFYVLRAAIPPLQRQGGGAIVFLSTVAARTGLPNHEAIAAAKAGLIGLTMSAAATYAPRRIRVNAVAPGLTVTPLAGPILANPAARQISEKMHPLGRLGEPGEIAAAIHFLVSPEAAWITGQVLSVDGGLSTLHPRPA